MGYWYGMMGFGWIWMMVIPVALISLIVYVAVKLSNVNNSRYGVKHQNSSQAIEILNQKFTNGEIDEEEYKRKKELLRK